ncbi:MAG: DUF1801 domain-containing protein [Phycisphaerales bacterium]
MGLKPTTVKGYLDNLPDDQRKTLAAVRTAIRKHLPDGYKEGLQYGMIGYYVPHSIYPPGYHCDPKQPLPFLSLAAQKNHLAVYLFCLYSDPKAMQQFEKAWKATGKKLDMGKSCVRFRQLSDVPLEVLGEAIGRVTVKKFVESYESGLESAGVKHPGKTGEEPERMPATKKAAAKKSADEAAKNAAKKPTKKAAKKTAKKATKKSPRKG